MQAKGTATFRSCVQQNLGHRQTTNAVVTTLACAGPTGVTLNAAVPPTGTNADIAGSNAWPNGVYNCTLTTTNGVGRQAIATSQLFMQGGNPSAPYGQPANSYAPGMACQDYKVWDPVAMTMTYHLSPFGHGIAWAAGTFVQNFAWNTPGTGWNLVAGSHWTMGPTMNGGIYRCP